jgi:twitching motility protein PilU
VRSVQGKQMPAVEILLNTSLIADQIKNDEIDKIRESMEKSVSTGSQTFEQALYKLFKKGQITKEEALRNADSASNLSSLVDFSERTDTQKVPIFSASQAAQKSPTPNADFGGIKLNLNEPK